MCVRVCDVFQVVYDENGQAIGVESEGETAKAKFVVGDPSYFPGKTRVVGRVVRAIAIMVSTHTDTLTHIRYMDTKRGYGSPYTPASSPCFCVLSRTNCGEWHASRIVSAAAMSCVCVCVCVCVCLCDTEPPHP